MKLLKILVVIMVLVPLSMRAQEGKTFKVRTLAFYNVENLFDTINNPNKRDDDRTPDGKDRWTSKVYQDKVKNTAKVISEIGQEVAKTPPALLGVSEVENKEVLVDVINHELLQDYDYGIVHYESPDRRGIDVALLYQKKFFTPLNSETYTLWIFDDESGKRVYTRDQLVVSGLLDGEKIHVIVNHWPSRFGGEARSRPKRVAAAKLNVRIIDSLQNLDEKAKIFTVGDFNDDPTNASFKKVLKTKSKKERVKGKDLYNPMEEMARKGVGSLAYRDSWNLFDQIAFTAPLLDKDYSGWQYYKAGVYGPRYLRNPRGRYKGYPFRSFAEGHYTGGYSDHFPVYVYLIKEAK